MKDDVINYCRTCDKCSAKKSSAAPKAPMCHFVVGEPMEKISLDILGPLPTSNNGNKYILVLVDGFTKWTEAYALKNQEARTIADTFVNQFICRFGTPLQIVTDQGSNFMSQLFIDMCELLHVDKVNTSNQHPQSNGGPERFNRTVLNMLAMFCQDNQKSWDEHLPQLLMAYRASVHSSIGITPNKMVFGREVTLPVEAVVAVPREPVATQVDTITYTQELKQSLEKVHDFARKSLRKSTVYQKRHYDLRARKRSFTVGQPVWLYNPVRRVGVCSKLTCNWKGPFIITRKLDDTTYLVKTGDKLKPKVYHIDRLLPYKGNNIPLWFSKINN